MNIPLNIDWQQIVLHAFNFILLTAGLYFLLFKPVKDFMDKRAAHYQEIEDEISAKQKEAKAMQAEYEQKLHEVEQEIFEKQTTAAKEMDVLVEESQKLAKAEADKILAQARVDAVKEREKVMAQAQKEIAHMAARATEKLVYASVPAAFEGFLSAVEGSDEDEQP